MMDWPVALRAEMLWTESTFCCSSRDVFGPAKKSTPPSDLAFKSGELLSPSSLPPFLLLFMCWAAKPQTFTNSQLPTNLWHGWPKLLPTGFCEFSLHIALPAQKGVGFSLNLAMTILSCSVAASPKLIPAHARVLDSPTHSMESLWRGVCLIVMLCSIFCANTTQAPHPAALQWILQSTQRCSNLKQSSSIAAAIPIGPG